MSGRGREGDRGEGAGESKSERKGRGKDCSPSQVVRLRKSTKLGASL